MRSKGHHGAGVIVDIAMLLSVRAGDRKKLLNELEVAALNPKEEKAVAGAGTIDALAQALTGKVDEGCDANSRAVGAAAIAGDRRTVLAGVMDWGELSETGYRDTRRLALG